MKRRKREKERVHRREKERKKLEIEQVKDDEDDVRVFFNAILVKSMNFCSWVLALVLVCATTYKVEVDLYSVCE